MSVDDFAQWLAEFPEALPPDRTSEDVLDFVARWLYSAGWTIGPEAPCVICGRPTSLRNRLGTPGHPVCQAGPEEDWEGFLALGDKLDRLETLLLSLRGFSVVEGADPCVTCGQPCATEDGGGVRRHPRCEP